MRVLAIGYGKNLFIAGHPEQVRQRACATVVSEYHMIVFARTNEGLLPQQIENFSLYPTGGRTRIGMVVRAYLIGKKIVRESAASDNFVVTAQDPFEAGLVGYLLAKKHSLALNLQEHGDFFSTNYWRQESGLNQVRAIVGKWLLRRATTVRVVSTRMLATMQQIGVASTKLRLLSVEVPVQRFLQAPPSTVARPLLPSGSIIVLTVARLVPQKNLSLLLRAFARVVAENPEAKLLIIGTGPEKTALITLATKLGLLEADRPFVVFLPWTDAVPAYMKSADVYALSSNYEGYARVIPEAMASGLPVLMTDVGCAGEVLQHGEQGLVVPVGDEDAFTVALTKLISDPDFRHQCSQTGQSTMQRVTEKTAYAERWLVAII